MSNNLKQLKEEKENLKIQQRAIKIRKKQLKKEEKQKIMEIKNKYKEEIENIGKLKIKEKDKTKYVYTLGEEIANAITHGVMWILCLIALPFAAIWAYLHGNGHSIITAVSVSTFVISILLMFSASMLYHVMKEDTKHKQIFHILDHIFIYVAIAGSYTPIALCIIGGWQGIVITAIQWVMVIFGILYKSLVKKSIPKVSLTIYLVMGWTVVFFFPLFFNNANIVLISLIAFGGIMYSVGAIFYAMKNFRYHHMVWHLFINLGAIAHFIGIVFFLY